MAAHRHLYEVHSAVEISPHLAADFVGGEEKQSRSDVDLPHRIDAALQILRRRETAGTKEMHAERAAEPDDVPGDECPCAGHLAAIDAIAHGEERRQGSPRI